MNRPIIHQSGRILGAWHRFQAWASRMLVTTEMRLDFYDRLKALHEQGSELSDALWELNRRYSRNGRSPNEPLAVATRLWAQRVADEGTSSIAQVFGRWVPTDERLILEAGSSGGGLSAALDDLNFVLKARKEMSGGLAKAVTQPLVYILLGLGLLYYQGLEAVPELARMVPIERWTGTGRLFGDVATFTIDHAGKVAAGLVIVVSVYLAALPRWTGRTRARLDSLWPLSMYRRSQSTAFLLSLAAMIRAGKTEVDALELMIEQASPYLKERLIPARRLRAEGKNIGQAFALAGMRFPEDDLLYDLEFFSRQQGFDRRIRAIAEAAQARAVKSADKLGSRLNLVGLAIAGFLVALPPFGIMDLSGQFQSLLAGG